MNLRERGITIGDLIIISIFILFSFFIINKIKEPNTEKQTASLYQLEIQKILMNK